MTSLEALLEAVQAGDPDAVAALLDAEPDLVQARPEKGPSPVLLAAYVGADAVTSVLRERGVELDVFEAAAVGDVARLSVLLIADAGGVRAFNGEGWTPLHLACFLGQKLAVDLLLGRGADVHAVSANATGNTPLHAALAGARDHAVVERLLAKGAAVDAVAAGGVTPLHLAASRGDVALIDLLLAHGAAPTETDDGRTPADLATERGHPEAAARLKDV